MRARTILGLVGVFLVSGCAARTAEAGGGSGAAATSRRSDGWTRAQKKKAPPRKNVALVTPRGKAGKPDIRTRAVANGRAILAGTAAKPKRQDCSGFVTTIFERAGHPLEIAPHAQKGTKSVAEMLYRTAKADGRTHTGAPKPGDLVFYRDTYGKIDGRITHIAVVESVGKDGTVMVIHNIGGRYRRSPMNLSDPHEPLKNGFFRKKGSANEPVLAGELFVAYARPG